MNGLVGTVGRLLGWLACFLAFLISTGHADRPRAMAASDTLLMLVERNAVRVFPIDSFDRANLVQPSLQAQLTLGRDLVDITNFRDEHFIVADAKTRELIGVDATGTPQMTFRGRLEIDPCRLCVGLDHNQICVTGKWNQAVQLLEISNDGRRLQPQTPIPLGFEPGSLLALPEQRFLIADAFGNYLAVVDGNTNSVVASMTIAGHQIRGMTLSSNKENVLLTHQIVSRLARTTEEDIHWGGLMRNVLSQFPLSALNLTRDAFQKTIRQTELGDAGNGFADPVAIIVDGDRHAVLSMGARQMIIMRAGNIERRMATGRRPVQMLSTTNKRIVVLNEQDGNLSLFRWDTPSQATISVTGYEYRPSAGEVAFYDASLSHDKWMTCNSCHVDGHTPALLVDTMGDGSFGTPKRIPSLTALKGTEPFGWIGNQDHLESQILATLNATMQAKSFPKGTPQALANYLRERNTQILGPRHHELIRDTPIDPASIQAGKVLFQSLACVNCHSPPHLTSTVSKDVGLHDEAGHRKFNPPSLLGLRFRRKFFHDGRVDSISAIIRDMKHEQTRKLSATEEIQLADYLQSL